MASLNYRLATLEDISKLRQDSRSPLFCSGVTDSQLDAIVHLLLHRSEPKKQETIDILASISNIILINRQLHDSHFTPQYAAATLDYINGLFLDHNFLDTTSTQLKDYDFVSLIPLYRLIFLTLYDGLPDPKDDLIERVHLLLIQGFKYCNDLYFIFRLNNEYKMAFCEVLKGLYALNHNHIYGCQLIQDQQLTNSVIQTINEVSMGTSSFQQTDFLLIKGLLNFLLGLFTADDTLHIDKSREIFFKENSLSDLDQLFDTLVKLLDSQLSRFPGDQFEIHEFNTLIVLTSLLTQFVISEYIHTDNNLQAYKDHLLVLFSKFKDSIIPTEADNKVYKTLMQIINMSKLSVLLAGDDQPNDSPNVSKFENHKVLYIRTTVFLFLYDLSWNKQNNKKEQMLSFLDLVGFLNAESCIKSNSLPLDSDIDVTKYLYPNPKFSSKADSHKNHSSSMHRTSLHSIMENIRDLPTNNNTSELTEEEKEIEAEKLFTVFERIEKLGAFKNFQNPVREWQQLGKFEDLDISG